MCCVVLITLIPDIIFVIIFFGIIAIVVVVVTVTTMIILSNFHDNFISILLKCSIHSVLLYLPIFTVTETFTFNVNIFINNKNQ